MIKWLPVAALATAVCSLGIWAAEDSLIARMHEEYIQSMAGIKDDMRQGVMNRDPDVAFAAAMLPHHVGAVDMARIELKYGKDPQMLALAEKILAVQDSEIAEIKVWLKLHPGRKQ
jgi:uncharacterized protein (DUF305 family)